MKDIPKFLIDLIDTDGFFCSTCDHGFSVSGITDCGIRIGSSTNEWTLFFSYTCKSCKTSVMLSFAQSKLVEDLCFYILEEIEGKSIKKVKPPKEREDDMFKDNVNNNNDSKSRSKITKSEQKLAVQLMDSCESFGEFLMKIGAPILKNGRDIEESK